MADLSAAERTMLIEQLGSLLRTLIGDDRNSVDFVVERGLRRTFGDDLEASTVAPNGTATLVVRINGGARDTTGFMDAPAAAEP